MSGEPSVVPTVSFRIVSGNPYASEIIDLPQTIKSFGYVDANNEFERPEHYIRNIEPTESELAKQVEYDMDEQDREWLEAVNEERRKEQSDRVSYEFFEILIDRLEKEWFDLMKRIPTPASMLPVEDSKCAICDDGEGENSNAIVFCDGCNLAVHQDCYGVPYIPEGQWLCRKCTVSPENPVDCLLCPAEAGAFKQTTYPPGQWAHLLCAIWIPEVGVGNQVYMEPIEGIESIPKSRWKLICSICKIRTGACIQCDNRSCFTAFHVSCARSEGLLSSMKTLGNDGILRAFCPRHIPAERRDELLLRNGGDYHGENDFEDMPSPGELRRASQKKSRGRITSDEDNEDISLFPAGHRKTAITSQSKSARAHAKVYTSGPPLVPALIVKHLTEYVKRIIVRKKAPFIERVCRYWSLKREARRGAPLLKRLHLEPWTAAHASEEQTDAEKAKKLEYLVLIRNDLERVRMLAELVRKREREKLRQAQVIKDFVDELVFPYDAKLRLTLEKIAAMDRNELFLNPVSRTDVPDYYDLIKEPMCWSEIDRKLETHSYENVTEFTRDVTLVLDNAMVYNPKDNPFHRTAARIKGNSRAFLADLENAVYGLQSSAGDGDTCRGALQPSAALLAGMLERNQDQSDLLADLFTFKLDPPRELTPPPPPKKQRPALTAVEIAARKEARKARFSAPRPPPTRATRATERLEDGLLESVGESTAPLKSETPVTPRRRTRSGPDSSRELNTPPDGQLMPPRKGQKGVAGLAPYSPITQEERHRREFDLALQVDKVDDRDNFKRFNVGWVLPEGIKRGGRSNLPLSANRTPKRSTRKGKEKASSVSISVEPSTIDTLAASSRDRAASESSLSELSDQGDLSPLKPVTRMAALHSGKPKDQAGELERPSRRATQKRKASAEMSEDIRPPPLQKELRTSRKSMTLASPPGEEPAPSVEPQPVHQDVEPPKSTRRKGRSSKGKAKAMKEVEPVELEPEQSAEDVPVDVDGVMEDVDVVKEDEDVDPQRAERLLSLDGRNNGHGVYGEGVEGDKYLYGTLVWAKATGFPFFPAEVVDIATDYYNIPETVWASRPKGDEETWLVQFFDASRSYSWCTSSKLDMLGESDETDAIYLSGKEKRKSAHFKSGSMVKACQKAYREARHQMATADEFD